MVPPVSTVAIAADRGKPVASIQEQAVDRLLADYDKPGTPGLAVGVFYKGRVLFVKTAGYADIEHDIKVTGKTRFELASVSKEFTGLAIAQLAQRGKIDLDADIHTYLSWVPAFDGAKITVRQLLHHTSGIREEHELCGLAGLGCESTFRLQHFRNIVARQKKLNFAPGTRYSYSNTGYMLLGEVVKAASGKSLRAYADENIFRPAGMTTFFLDEAAEPIPDQAIGYMKDGKGGWTREPVISDSVGEAGAQATIGDMMMWVKYLSQMPQRDPALYRTITTPAILPTGKLLYGFGLDMAGVLGHPSVGHGGGLQGYAHHYAYLPNEDFGVVVLTLNGGFDCVHIADEILKIYVGDASAKAGSPQIVKPDPALVKAIAGTFIAPESEFPYGVDSDRIDISSANGVPVVSQAINALENRDVTSPITFYSDGAFTFGEEEGNEIRYRPVLERGNVVALDKFDIFQPETHFRYLRTATTRVTGDALSEFEGKFCSDELDVCYDLRRNQDALTAEAIGTTVPVDMTSDIKDRFDSPGAWYFLRTHFVRDGNGKIAGMNVSTYRALNTFFAKR